jgi:hypothetical protein
MVNGNKITELGDTLIIKLIEPYLNVNSIQSFEDATIGEDSNNYFSKFFRWSTDNKVFSEYVQLTDINLQKINLNPAEKFWIEYKYEATELDTGQSLEFVSIALEVITENGRILSQVQVGVDACSINETSCCTNLIIEDCCNNEEQFSPYSMAAQSTSLYNQLTEITTNLFGHCVRYYRATPNERSRDSVLKEDSLFKRNVVKEIKVLVPDNAFPTNEFQFDPFIGMGHEGFEIHITRKEFEMAFGGNERPRERDSMFFEINQKMYEVSSVALSDEIMYMHAYWRVKLKKWEDKLNIENSPEIEVELDDLIVNMNEVFQDDVNDEFLKITKPQQYNTIGTGKNDYVRSSINKDITIVDEKINNNWTIVSKNYYDLSKLPLGSVAAKYRLNAEIKSTDNRAYSFWFRSKFLKPKPRLVISTYTDNNGDLQLTTTSQHGYKINDIIEISSVPEYSNTIHYVKEIIDSNTFVLATPFILGAGTINGKVRFKQFAPILYGYNISNPTNNGISIEILNGYINVSINNVNYTFATSLDEYLADKWYSVVVNMSNKFNQLAVYLYSLDKPLNYTNPQGQDTSLTLISQETKDLNGPITINSGDQYALLGSLVDLTNIRIFEIPIEEESHDAVLNQYVVRDTQLALLVDNAIPQIKLMKLSNPR